MADKRDILRLKKRLAVRFGPEEANRPAFTEDISRTGMFLKSANVCQPNTKIRVEFELDGTPVTLLARVMWAKKVPQNMFHLVKKSGMGIRFLRFELGEESYANYIDMKNV